MDAIPAKRTKLTSEEEQETSGKQRRLSKKERKAKRNQKKNEHLAKQQQEEKASKDTDYLKDYEAIPVPPEKLDDEENTSTAAKALTGWFPSARVIKCDTDANTYTTCSILLFYQYVAVTNDQHISWSKQRVNQLLNYLIQVCETRKTIGGRIRISTEGVNATISSLGPQGVRHIQQDFINFDPSAFQETDFKFIDDLPCDRHFSSMKIIPVQELVYYGFHLQEKEQDLQDTDNAPINKEDLVAPLHQGGIHLNPKDYHDKLKMNNTVVIDVRNHYEAAIGRFDGAPGADYIDPKMRKSTDFAQWIQNSEIQENLKGKQVLMFCTGGIRCERASAYLNKKLGKDLTGVYQLKGGIERYLQEFPDGGFWRGKNFVFDKREAVSADNKAGDGGVVKKEKKKSGTTNNNNAPDTHCCLCGDPWDRYVGKRKCYTCGVPVLMCDKCMSKKKQTEADKGNKEDAPRCPLCKEQSITVPVSQVEYTENGLKGKVTAAGGEKRKAAATVLKWGGGHATEKKQLRKMKRKQCRFGSECNRNDCYFAHPDRGV